MGKAANPFKDKSRVRVFRLVNRSVMGDEAGGGVDEEGNPLPDRVFAEVTPHQEKYEEEEEEIDVGQSEIDPSMVTERAGEAVKYGIFFDDRHYDYRQHLKPIGQAPGAVWIAAPAATIAHGLEAESEEASERRLNHATYDGMLRDAKDVDPAVLQTLEALEDEAFIDEDGFEDDLIVKLDREEAGVLVSLESLHRSRKGATAAGGAALDTDFSRLLSMYDEDGEGFEVEEFEEEEFDEDEDVNILDDDDEDYGEDADGKMGNKWYQLDEVRQELAAGDPRLLAHILYTSDEEDEEVTGRKTKKSAYQVIQVENEADARLLNCQTACQWAPSRTAFRPQIIRAGDCGGPKPAPIRISRKTGLPFIAAEENHSASLNQAIPIPKGAVEAASDSEAARASVNRGEARPREETPEEKRTRKTAVKEAQKAKRAAKKTVQVK